MQLFVFAQVYLPDLIVGAPQSLSVREKLKTLKARYAFSFTDNVIDHSYLGIAKITVFVGIVSCYYTPEIGIGEILGIVDLDACCRLGGNANKYGHDKCSCKKSRDSAQNMFHQMSLLVSYLNIL